MATMDTTDDTMDDTFFDTAVRSIRSNYSRYHYLKSLRTNMSNHDHQLIRTLLSLTSPLSSSLTTDSILHPMPRIYNILDTVIRTHDYNAHYYRSLRKVSESFLESLIHVRNKYPGINVTLLGEHQYHRFVVGGLSNETLSYDDRSTAVSAGSNPILSTLLGTITYDDIWNNRNPSSSFFIENNDHLQDQAPMLWDHFSKTYHDSVILVRPTRETTELSDGSVAPTTDSLAPSILTILAPFTTEKLFGIQDLSLTSIDELPSTLPSYPLVPITLHRRLSIDKLRSFIDQYLPVTTVGETEIMKGYSSIFHELLNHPTMLNESVAIDTELLLNKRTGYYIEKECTELIRIYFDHSDDDKHKLRQEIETFTGSSIKTLRKLSNSSSNPYESIYKVEQSMVRRLYYTDTYVDVYLPLHPYDNPNPNHPNDGTATTAPATFPHLSIRSFASSLHEILQHYENNPTIEKNYFTATRDAVEKLNKQYRKGINSSNDWKSIPIETVPEVTLAFQRRILRLLTLVAVVMDQSRLETDTWRSVFEPVAVKLTSLLFGHTTSITDTSPPPSTTTTVTITNSSSSSSGYSSVTSNVSNVSSVSTTSIIDLLIKKGDEKFGPIVRVSETNEEDSLPDNEVTEYNSPLTGFDRSYYRDESVFALPPTVSKKHETSMGTESVPTTGSSNTWVSPSSSISTIGNLDSTAESTPENSGRTNETIHHTLSYSTPKVTKQYGRKANAAPKYTGVTWKPLLPTVHASSDCTRDCSMEGENKEMIVPQVIRKPFTTSTSLVSNTVTGTSTTDTLNDTASGPTVTVVTEESNEVNEAIEQAAKLAMDNAMKHYTVPSPVTVHSSSSSSSSKTTNGTFDPPWDVQAIFTDDEHEHIVSSNTQGTASSVPPKVYRQPKHRRTIREVSSSPHRAAEPVLPVPSSPPPPPPLPLTPPLPLPANHHHKFLALPSGESSFRSICRLAIMDAIFSTERQHYSYLPDDMKPICLCATVSIPLSARRTYDNDDDNETTVTCLNPSCSIGTYHHVCYFHYLPSLPRFLLHQALSYWYRYDNIHLKYSTSICTLCHWRKVVHHNPSLGRIIQACLAHVDMTLITDAVLTDTVTGNPVWDELFRTMSGMQGMR